MDIFLDDVCLYAKRLEEFNVQQNLRIYPGVFHAAEIQGYGTTIGSQMTNDYVQALVNSLGT